MFDFSIVSNWIDCLLRQTLGLGDFWTILIECVLVGVGILVAYALIAIVLIFMERKVCAYFQCRIGPVRVGPWGTLQVFADVLKMLIKEIFTVDKADKFLYFLAPFLVIAASVGTFSFLPWNKGMHVLDFNVGVFLLTAISSIGVLGIFLAGWGSNNKYSVVSAMRGAVQMISYEMSLCLCLICVVIMTGSMQLSEIVTAQTGPWKWLIIQGHVPAILAFLAFLVAGMGFGFYYLAEYLNLFVISGIASGLFLGGWAPLNIGIEAFDNLMNLIPGFIWFFGKTFFVVWLLMWVRWTFPRLRVDQILKLEWKYIMPFMLCVLVLTSVCVALGLTF